MAKGDAKRTGKRKTKVQKEAADAVIKAEAAQQVAQVAIDEATMIVAASLDEALATGNAAAAEAARKEKRRLAALKGAETRRRNAAARAAAAAPASQVRADNLADPPARTRAPRKRRPADPLDSFDGYIETDAEYELRTLGTPEQRKRRAYREALLARLQKKMPELRDDVKAIPYLKHVTVFRDKDKVHYLPAYTAGKNSDVYKYAPKKQVTTAWVRPVPGQAEREKYVGKRSDFAKWFEL